MKNTLVVIQTYNPKNNPNNAGVWRDVVSGWIKQRNECQSVDIIIVDCISHPDQRKKLLVIQKDFGIDLLFVNQRVIEMIGYNLAFLRRRRDYDYYAINVSDAILATDRDLTYLMEDMNYYNDTLLLIPTVDHDYIEIQDIYDVNKPPTQFSVTYWPQAHLSFFDKQYMKIFDYRLMDIIGNGCCQICYPNLLASIRKKAAICHKIRMHHIGRMEYATNPSSLLLLDKKFYYTPLPEWAGLKNPTRTELWDRFYKMIEKGVPLGLSFGHRLGYGRIIEPDPNAFDKNGYAKRGKELYDYMRDNFFLKKEQFDYDKVNCEWIPYKEN